MEMRSSGWSFRAESCSGRANISLSDVMNLDVGDVMRTDRAADAEVELWAGDRHVFDCRPGMRGTKPSVVISAPTTHPGLPIQTVSPECAGE